MHSFPFIRERSSVAHSNSDRFLNEIGLFFFTLKSYEDISLGSSFFSRFQFEGNQKLLTLETYSINICPIKLLPAKEEDLNTETSP